MARRFGYLLAKEMKDYMMHLKSDDVWSVALPMAANPSTSEGLCGLMKYMWGLSNNVRTRDEFLRSKVVAATTSLRPRQALFLPALRRALLRRIRQLEQGGVRNDTQSERRLAELEAKRSGRVQALAKKRVIAARRVDIPLIASETKLRALTKEKLIDQGAIRGLKRFRHKTKEEIIQLCLAHRKRKRYEEAVSEVSEGYDTDTVVDVFSQGQEDDEEA
jgi:hypothetical protein